MTKKRLFGWLGALGGIAATIVIAKQPHHSPAPPSVPPSVPVYTLVVHVCAGDCAADHKIPGASVTIDGQPTAIMDGAGNGTFPNIPAGQYRVCAAAERFVGACLDQRVPADGEASFALARDVPPIQPVHGDGKIFRLSDGAPWRYMGVSAFQLLNRYAAGENIQPVLDAYRGFNVLRVWCYTPIKDWGARAWDVPTAEQVRAFVAFVGAQGWRVELTILTDDDPVRAAWGRAFVPQLAGMPNLLIEEGNEPTTHKHIDTAALDGVVAALGVPWTSGDYEDEAKMRGSYGVAHTGRDGDWPRRAHDLLEYYDGTGPETASPPHHFPIVADEPAKLQDVSGDRASDWLAYFAACSLLGGGATFHSETGKYGLPPTPEEAVLAAAALRGLTAFPADAPLGPYSRPSDDTLRTYRVGPYGVRIRPTSGPVLIGAQ